jgi:hypothetical protein
MDLDLPHFFLFEIVSACIQADMPPANLWSVDDVFGGWAKAQAKFFDAKKILDNIQVGHCLLFPADKRRERRKKKECPSPPRELLLTARENISPCCLSLTCQSPQQSILLPEGAACSETGAQALADAPASEQVG